MIRPTPKLGQTLYALNVGNAARNCVQKLTPCKVVKIGRKYFEVQFENYSRTVTFHLDNWCEKTEYTSDYCLYTSPLEWEEEKEAEYICKEIYQKFEYGRNRHGISIQTLRVIGKLISDEN